MELRSRTIGMSDPSGSLTGTPNRKGTSNRSRKLTGSQASSDYQYPIWQVIAGWLVHLYTGTGLLVNSYCIHYAIYATRDFGLFARLNWLAIFIDATDGTMARMVDIKKVVPTYDGAMLDNIIDFQTFTLLPALSVIRFELVPGLLLQYIVAGAILISSGYQFCQVTAKTTEAFVGFPSYWNIVVFYVYYLEMRYEIALAIFFTCFVLSFVPIHFIYPTRTKRFLTLNLVGAYIWATMLVLPSIYPTFKYIKPLLYVSFVYVFYYIGMSLFLDFRRRKEEE